MGLRDDLIDLVDDARDGIVDGVAGLRLHTVTTVLRTWDGGEVGLGDSSDTETTLDPKPRVRPPSPRLVAAAPGRFEEGDLLVDRISAEYDEDDLTGGSLAAGTEFWWSIDGRHHRVVGVPEERYLEWRVQLRRMKQRPAATTPES